MPVRPGDTLGSALHRAGVLVLSRSMKYHRPRGLYCCTGSCASCFVDVDGVPNVPACTTAAAPGMEVRSQNTLGSARRDLLGVVDKVYRRGFDPHGAFTRPRIVNTMFLKAVRFMSGVGEAPEETMAVEGAGPQRLQLHVHHLVVGGGRKGLLAAKRHAHRGLATLLVDEAPRLGGSAASDPAERDTLELAAAAEAGAWPAVEAWTGTLAFGVYGDVVALRRGDDLWEVRADRITLAPGRHDAWPLFVNNDLPGVLSLRGARRLLHGHGVLPGRAVVGHGDPLPASFVEALEAAGGRVVGQGEVTEAAGSPVVERARLGEAWVRCDAIVCNLPGTPRVELFQQAGCRLGFEGGVLAPATGKDGATSVEGMHAAFGGPP